MSRGEEQQSNDHELISVAEILNCVEYICWTCLALWPILRLLNGRSVSSDQRIMRAVLLVLPAIGAITLRARKWYLSRSSSP